MSKAACFPLSQMRTSTVHPLTRYGLGQVLDRCPTLPSLQGGHDGRTQKHITQMIVDTCFTGQGGGD